ncbi:MAG: IPT/TIG domain-containing protein [Deltaproteobacteria bacterium]|nr:IPT/TIG domain-containing protein [Deltaproteobacteria bacterium]
MRVAIFVMLWACGDGGGSAADGAVPDTEPPPDAPAPVITGFNSGDSACRGGIASMVGMNLQGATGTISGIQQMLAGTGPDFFQITVADLTPAGIAPIVVETVGGTTTSPPLTVRDEHTAEITGSSPAVGSPNDAITLTGTGLFGAIVQLRTVAPPNGGTAADVTASSDTSLTFTLPNVAPGDYFIQAGQFPGCGYGRGAGSITVI